MAVAGNLYVPHLYWASVIKKKELLTINYTNIGFPFDHKPKEKAQFILQTQAGN